MWRTIVFFLLSSLFMIFPRFDLYAQTLGDALSKIDSLTIVKELTKLKGRKKFEMISSIDKQIDSIEARIGREKFEVGQSDFRIRYDGVFNRWDGSVSSNVLGLSDAVQIVVILGNGNRISENGFKMIDENIQIIKDQRRFDLVMNHGLSEVILFDKKDRELLHRQYSDSLGELIKVAVRKVWDTPLDPISYNSIENGLLNHSGLGSYGPSFRGGLSDLYKMIEDKLQYPQKALEFKLQGRVFVEFTVKFDGSVSNVKTVKGLGLGCDEEAERVILLSSGNWIPDEYDGMPIDSKLVLPVTFKIE